jgi:hypothetical protein
MYICYASQGKIADMCILFSYVHSTTTLTTEEELNGIS